MPDGSDVRSGADCRVYWGSHGCRLERGHDGPHLCTCADIPAEDGGVGKPPYYGPDTHFYGEDASDVTALPSTRLEALEHPEPKPDPPEPGAPET